MRRRTFLQMLGGAAAGARSLAANAAGGIRLGFDTWTLHDYGWTAIDFLDYADQQRLDTVQLSDLFNYASLDPAYLRKVKERAETLGVTIDGGLGCICPTARNYRQEYGDAVEYLRKGLRANSAAGARCMRCYLGGEPERRGPLPLGRHIEATVKALRAVRSEALDLGVMIAVENHGDLQAWELRNLIEEAGKEFVGACLDTGNPLSVIEDPMTALETLGPYVVTTHVKDFAVFEHPRGAAAQGVALGEGSIDYPRFFERFRQLCPRSAAQLEILTGGPPRVVPYLEPEFWRAFPSARASEFARFVALARQGRPFMGSMMIAGPGSRPPEYDAAVKKQQQVDLERSFEYARKVLGLGIRGRS
ncbi:MAG: sugar phosphate isomerase/epimerase [Bryobacteraceae bacterium]|nr:sugar phosphate isomerase/epimerase [Bryobacteraceae bacterium]